MSMSQPEQQVVMDPDSKIGEFDCGVFRGYAMRMPARKTYWHAELQEMVPAKPAYWRVRIDGVGGGWCQVTMPLKRGRTLEQAIKLACHQFTGPADITPDKHGNFANYIDLQD